MGADYLVVGRPILTQPTAGDRRRVAQAIIEEIDSARGNTGGASPGNQPTDLGQSASPKD